MGNCFQSKPSNTIDRKISKSIEYDKKLENRKKKLLILGAKGSGKSTIFNQLKYLKGNGFDDLERMESKQLIYEYMIESIQEIIECIEEYEKYKQFAIHKYSLNEEAKISANYLKSLQCTNIIINNVISNHIQILWKQNVIQRIVENAPKYYIDVSIKYFLQNIQRISTLNYIPNDQDIIQLRIKSDGFNETNILMGNDKFAVYDINYKRNCCSMNKYLHCFEHVTAIIFVASLSCFDQRIFEDEKSYKEKLEWKQSLESMTKIVGDDILNVVLSFVGYPKNAMYESLDVFDELCNSHYFKEIPVLLFLSKSDLFATKIAQYQIDEDENNNHDINPFNVCFNTFNQQCTYTTCSKYIEQQFKKLNKNKERLIYSHLVNGTDITIMTKIFNDVQTIIINAALSQNGLI